MRFGVMFDVHGTLIHTSEAWIQAFTFYCKDEKFCREWLENKGSRKALAKKIGIPFESVHNLYREKISANDRIVSLFEIYRQTHEVIIVSNAKKEDVVADCDAVHIPLDGVKIFSSEMGKKPDSKYLKRILDEMKWDKALLIGNDMEEDMIEIDDIITLMVPM